MSKTICIVTVLVCLYITVLSQNNPIANGDTVVIAYPTLSTDIHVLANDSDPDGDDFVITSITAPLNGIARVNADGTITYAPIDDFDGVDSFVYQICDNGSPASLCDTAMVLITVTRPAFAGYRYEVSDSACLAYRFIDTSRNHSGVPMWDFGDGTTTSGDTVVHVFATEGTYDVCVSVSHRDSVYTNCGWHSFFGFYAEDHCVGVADEWYAALQLYPNPATDFVTITNLPEGKGELLIINQLGQIHQRFEFKEGSNIIDLAAYPAGLYFTRMVKNGQYLPEAAKLIVQK